MAKRSLFLLACIILWCLILQASSAEDIPIFGPLVPKESRRTLIATESGVITAVDVFDGLKGAYHLQFFTLEPSSLFLPVLLHTDMVFYVQTGRGTVSWARDDSKDGTTNLDVERGDVYRLEEGSIFYIRSHPDPAREKLRVHAIFNSFNSEDSQETSVGVYSNVSDLVCGFDDRVLQMGFKASEDDVRAIKSAIKPPPIVHFAPNKTEKPNWTEVFETLMGGRNPISLINGKKRKKTKTKTFNVFKETPDVENCNGWSVAVTNRGLSALKHSNIGVFMVNLTKGSMTGPHWNPRATEIAIVLEGQGMVQIVGSSGPSGSQPATGLKCQNMRFKVREGDVFIVPRFNPMAHMSFNNESLVFMGFSTSVKNNRPQYLAGKWSVLRTIDRDILAVSLGASNATIEKILASQDEGVMLECTSCAEEVEKTMVEEEARRKKEEEEARRREDEEAKKREEEEARKREEEARKREEEAKKREEEARKREEEEARKREEEEEKKRREEEEARKREEEEARKREEEARKEEEEEEKKRREEEEARKREEEEAKKREEEEARKREEEARKREEEEEKKREEEARKREEEEEKKRREEEESRKREEEEEARKREEEEEKKRREEEEARKREEEARKREKGEEARKREEETRKEEEKEARKREEETRKEEEKEVREEEEKARRREEKARKRKEDEEARKREEETRKEEEKEVRKKQEEEARRREEEEARKREEEEEEIQRQEQEEIRRQEEEAKEREEGGGDMKIEEDEEEKKGSQETSGGGRVTWRKIWMAKS